MDYAPKVTRFMYWVNGYSLCMRPNFRPIDLILLAQRACRNSV